MSEDQISLSDIQRTCALEEDQGFDAPFATFTWARWQEMQAQTVQGFTRFQRAIDQRQPQVASLIALEMQQIVMELQKEVCTWIGLK
jgi:hypothetical protein